MRLLLRGTPLGIRPIHTQAYIFQRVLVISLNIRGCRRRAAREPLCKNFMPRIFQYGHGSLSKGQPIHVVFVKVSVLLSSLPSCGLRIVEALTFQRLEDVRSRKESEIASCPRTP
jgi:hypothetical protein